MSTTIRLLALTAACVCASPLPSAHVQYDQRQEGEINIRADLENFVILVIPTTSSSSSGLLDFLSKSVPLKSLKQRKKPAVEALDAQNFIESKTAPYHVDITNSRNNLEKLHPNVEKNEELLMARSPGISLNAKNEGGAARKEVNINGRYARAFLVSIPVEANDVRKEEEQEEKEKFYEKNNETKIQDRKLVKGELLLLGAENEQCGPDGKRDEEGICKYAGN